MGATGGLTIPAEGIGGSWIVKLPSMKFAGVPENEFAMMELARAVDIKVPEVRLVSLSEVADLPEDVVRMEGNVLAVKRFDRTEDGRFVHVEDFAQVFGLYPEKKYGRASYQNIAEVLWAETSEEDIAELIRAGIPLGNGVFRRRDRQLNGFIFKRDGDRNGHRLDRPTNPPASARRSSTTRLPGLRSWWRKRRCLRRMNGRHSMRSFQYCWRKAT